jgi:hypothetical protein
MKGSFGLGIWVLGSLPACATGPSASKDSPASPQAEEIQEPIARLRSPRNQEILSGADYTVSHCLSEEAIPRMKKVFELLPRVSSGEEAAGVHVRNCGSVPGSPSTVRSSVIVVSVPPCLRGDLSSGGFTAWPQQLRSCTQAAVAL